MAVEAPLSRLSQHIAVPDSWRWERLDNVCAGVYDCPHSTPRITEQGPFLARSQDIRSGVFRLEEAARVSDETYRQRIARAEPRHGDLLYSREGTYFGIAAEVPRDARVCLGQRMVLIRPDPTILNSRFLLYWLNSPALKEHARGQRDGSVAERLNLPTIRALPIAVPPLSEQRAIAHVLGALDDKIEVNRRMKDTLEAMARALFKSWFVDFDPVRTKADGRGHRLPKITTDLFPDRFQHSEHGEIPEGWRFCEMSEVCGAIFSGGTPNTSRPAYWGGGIPWLSSGETRSKFIVATEKTITANGVAESSARLARTGATVIASAGQGHTRGQTSMLLIDSYINQSVVALQANPHCMSDAYLFFDLERRYEQFRRLSDGHSSRGSLTTRLLGDLQMVVPPMNLLQAFDKVAAPVVHRIAGSLRTSRTLADIRDAILPRLISGDIRVSQAEQILTDAAV
jgi:type I restriction enzyme S subunit